MRFDGGHMDTDRVAVRTYVPAYQKEEWQEHAEELDMSQSEFVRSMVQAGRRGFEFGDSDEQRTSKSEEQGNPGVNPGGKGLEDRVLDLLEPGSHYDWDELVANLTDDIEERLDDALATLQRADRIRYSGRHGGYMLVDDER